jgi:type I restriction enzyme S subunit
MKAMAADNRWPTKRLGDIANLLAGVSYDKSAASDRPFPGHVPILRATNIGAGILNLESDLVYVPDRFVDEQQRLRAGDIVVCTSSGSRSLVGKAAQIRHAWQGSFGAFCAVVRPDPDVNPYYVGHFLQSDEYRDFVRVLSSGININNLRRRDLASVPVPVPPLSTQAQIVAEIEKQVSRLDAGVAALKRAQVNLKRYRAAVLKAACEGRLVPQDPNDEPASELLKRILAERRVRWEAKQLAKMRAKGQEPKDDRWKEKYEEPKGPDDSDLPVLPNGWCWARLGQLYWDAGYGTSEKCVYDGLGPPVLRIPNVARGRISIDDVKRVVHRHDLVGLDPLAPNDYLIIRTNGSKELIGRGALVKESFNEAYYFASYLIRIRIAGGASLASWLSAIWDTPWIRQTVEKEAATTAGQYNISLRVLERLLIPLPPKLQQTRIAAAIEERLSLVDYLEAVIGDNLGRSESLRQATLARAFEGKLAVVPMKSNRDSSVRLNDVDEPSTLNTAYSRAFQAALPGLDR